MTFSTCGILIIVNRVTSLEAAALKREIIVCGDPRLTETEAEELETMNDELQRRADEVRQVNGCLASILNSISEGVTVLNRDLGVMIWNRIAEDQWALRTEEAVGQHFRSLDIGLPVEQLRPALGVCLAGEPSREELVLPATSRRSRRNHYHVAVTPLNARSRAVNEFIVSTEEQEG